MISDLTCAAKLYPAKTDDGKFFFPEQKHKGVNPNKPCLGLSGGGSKGFLAGMAMIKMIEKYDYMKDTSYISTVSGSGWVIAPYMFNDLNYGGFRLPENITMDLLKKDRNGTADDVLVDTPIYSTFMKIMKSGNRIDRYWNNIVGKCYLDKYDLNGKPMVSNKEDADFFSEVNNIDCVYPKSNRPFWLANSTLFTDNGPVYITSTPMYSGMQARLNINGKVCGGYLIETPCLGSFNPDVEIHEDMVETDIGMTEVFTLNDIIGTSSSAFSGLVLNFQKRRWFSKYIPNPNSMYNIWDYKTDKNIKTVIGDGYSADNTGLLALLARGCKKVIIMSANLEINDNDYYNANVLPWFGLWNTKLDEGIDQMEGNEGKEGYGGNGGSVDSSMSDTNQVFKKRDWLIMKKQIEKRKKDGGPVYARCRFEVLENKRNCIKGGYVVDILVYFLYPCRNYIEKLPLSVQLEINKGGRLANFPNFLTVRQNKDQIAGYTKIQCNILFYYVQWLIRTTKNEIDDMYL